MCPTNSNCANIRNENGLESLILDVNLDVNENSDNESIINNTRKIITELQNISRRIRYYTDYINTNWNNSEKKYQDKIKLYLNNLKELYDTLPKFIKNDTNEEIESSCCWKTIKYTIAPLVLLTGIVIRVAQRYFSIAVVSNQEIIGKIFLEQLKILFWGMTESLQIPENYAMASIDIFLSYALSYYPFGLKNLVNLFTKNQCENKQLLNEYLPLEIVIKNLEQQLMKKQYQKLNENIVHLESLSNQLQTIVKKHDLFNHLKEEFHDYDFNDNFSFEQFNQIIANSDDFLNDILKEVNQLTATDLKIENYSLSKIISNSWSNIKFFLTTLTINHLVITAASAYTAQTLTWETYKEDIVSINNIISTIVRGTVMKFVNEYFIKSSLSTLFKPVINYLWPNNDNSWLKKFKDCVNNQNKLAQAGIFFISFIFTSFITNAIKTYAADVTQNKGDWKKAWIQFKETFPKLGMIASALCVTSSDLYNLTNKMKPVFKLIYKEKAQQQIIDEILLALPSLVNEENTNDINNETFATNSRRDNPVRLNWETNSTQEIINNSDREPLLARRNNSNFEQINI